MPTMSNISIVVCICEFVGGARNIVKNKIADVRWININFHVKKANSKKRDDSFLLCMKIELYAIWKWNHRLRLKKKSGSRSWESSKTWFLASNDFQSVPIDTFDIFLRAIWDFNLLLPFYWSIAEKMLFFWGTWDDRKTFTRNSELGDDFLCYFRLAEMHPNIILWPSKFQAYRTLWGGGVDENSKFVFGRATRLYLQLTK